MTRPSRMGGKTSEAKARNASPAKGRKTTKTKHRIAPAATRVKRRSVSGPSKDLKEAREQQAATAEILKVIASSPGDVQPVFEAIAQSANRLLGGFSTAVFRFVDHVAHLAAFTPTTPAADRVLQSSYPMPPPNFEQFELAKKGQPVQTPDIEQMSNRRLKEIAQLRGFRSMLFVPLMNSGIPIGFISVTRLETGSFADHHVELLQTFADQAVIAIENARLFNETQEALKYQTATSEVLQVIGRSMTDAQPVFERILDSTERLFDCRQVGIFLAPGDGLLHVAARRGTGYEAIDKLYPQPIEQTAAPRVLGEGRQVYFPDVMNGVDVPSSMRRVVQVFGNFSVVMTPMIWEGQGIGQISVLREPNASFTPKELSLLRTFADQAVIAIENVRLFNETKEALERQTATADILKVIASSPSDVQPVFEAIAERSNRLVEGLSTAVYRLVDDTLHLMAFTRISPQADAVLEASYPRPLSSLPQGEQLRCGELVHVRDAEVELAEMPALREMARQRGWRSSLLVPLLRDRAPIGLISVTHKEPGTFAAHHVQLLQTFADQAVIAIENVRLFNETREALERQTATADILKVIASSPDDVQPVFEAIAERSNRLVNGLSTAVFSVVDDAVRLMSFTSVNATADAALKAITDVPLSAFPVGEAMRKGEIAQIADTEDEVTPDFLRDVARLRGWRSSLTVPMLREGMLIGIIAVTRVEPGLFDDHHIQLLKTFADQAMIAISNVGLFNEVQDRTRKLSQSLDDLRAAQDRLVQTEKLASLGQLTAGIAHEIKNPLNFVNNFSALSAELTDDLNDLLKAAALTDKMREEVNELTRLLKENLEKVVQHGRRADSIVKNMLLHSREGSGERRSADINALVGESLNLAYHGARAEKAGFSMTLKHDLDPEAGALDLFPQEITRALLNLISNGFYAATRRKAEAGDGTFEPVLSAATRNLGKTVEIRIRDNGTGIPPDVREKMFNPFFTTKPTGEGTGLGLSMTHDIIVKQHGGSIDVETEPGEFTEFIITLPRDNGTAAGEKPA